MTVLDNRFSISLTPKSHEGIIFIDKNRVFLTKAENIIMTLYEAKKDHEYTIRGLYVEEAVTRRLQALGLNDGTKIQVLNRKRRGALIIRVRGTRLALGKHLSSGIEIGEVQHG